MNEPFDDCGQAEFLFLLHPMFCAAGYSVRSPGAMALACSAYAVCVPVLV